MLKVSNSLTTLAMLKVNLDSNQSYVSTFLPFVLSQFQNSSQLEIQEVQDSISENFKLRIPLNSLRSLLEKARRKNYVYRDGEAYFPIKERLKNLDFENRRSTAMRQQNDLLRRLISYLSSYHDLILTEVEAEEALFNYIRQRDFDVLRSTVFGSPFISDSENQESNKKLSYNIGLFVKFAYESDKVSFELLDSYVKAYMLSQLLIFEDIAEVDKPFSNVEFYFDTPFLLRLLGYTYPEYFNACEELMTMLCSEGCKLCVFQHTVDEVVGVLTAIMIAIKNPTQKVGGEVGRYCMNNYVTPSDIELTMSTLDERFKKYSIEVKDTPIHIKEYELGENELRNYLQANYHYNNPLAMDRDIDSVSAIFRLRKGKHPRGLHECIAAFITTNSLLAKHTYAFLFQNEYYTHFPLVITDHLATNLVWAKCSNKFGLISKKQLIADAIALTNPDEMTWRKYVEEIERLRNQGRITPDETLMLLYSNEVRNAIMEITQGGEIELNSKNIFDVIFLAKERITNEEKVKLINLQKKLDELAALKENLSHESQKVESLTGKLKEEESKNISLQRIIEKNLNAFSKIISFLIIALPTVSIAAAMLELVPPPYNYITSSILVVATFMNLFTGFKIIDLQRKIESRIFGWLLGKLQAQAGS